jgi:N-alpha-acetyl-L-2,4-diaminobutyrate deacetylase
MTSSLISSTVPFDQDGTHHGFLNLPHSRNDSAWGSIMIPITVVRNGEGPTALLSGANHGDEYEGPIALQNLCLSLKPQDITGRVIILPAMNYPAFSAGTRTSPIDGGNMNRSFPGDPRGGITGKIADYVLNTLVVMADVVLDIHSGGKTLEFLPMTITHILDDKMAQDLNVQAARAFAAPYNLMLLELESEGQLDGAVEALGKTFLTTELGGGGTTTARTVQIARRGVRNFLIHAGIVSDESVGSPPAILTMPDAKCYVLSEHGGLIEPLADLGDTVVINQPVAQIWPLDRTGIDPIVCRARRAGLLAARHFPGHVQSGDCLAVIAQIEE